MSHESNKQGDLKIHVDKPEHFEGPRHKRAVLGLAKAALEIHNKEKLINEGLIDKKTGLKNDKAFIEDMDERLENAQEGDVSVLFFDLDKLKSVNDTISWEVGDKYKITAGKTVAKEFSSSQDDDSANKSVASLFGLRDTDDIYIIGGDEIIVVLDHRYDEGDRPVDFEGITSRVQNKVAENVYGINELKDKPGLGVSAGWATFEENDTRASLVERAHDIVLQQKNVRYASIGEQDSRLQDTRL